MIVELEKICKTYQSKDGEVQAVEDIDIAIKEGEFVSIVGTSGCGKSTLLSIIAGLEKPTHGKIFIDGHEQTKPSTKIGYMPQKDQLFPWRTIWANVTLGLEIAKMKDQAHTKHARELLERYGLDGFAEKTPKQLSGGMRQRCALIRTLAISPSILLLDEPFSALDYQTRLAVSDDIHEIIKRENKTAILVTHDISESIAMSDRVIILTPRPAKVNKIIDLKDLAGMTPMQRRGDDKFREYFNIIWKELDVSA